MGKRLTQEIYDKLPKLYNEGKTIAELAEQFGVSGSTIHNHLVKQKVPMRKTGNKLPDSTVKCWWDMYYKWQQGRQGGKSLEEIAREYGITRQSVHLTLIKHGYINPK
jgi:predicted DNA-binding protein YlxM (UPF0122 family)